jgi:hypothetical protein
MPVDKVMIGNFSQQRFLSEGCAYHKTLGPERHPSALGQRGRRLLAEIWNIIGPQIAYVMQGNGSAWDEERLVPVTRNGALENVYWTYSCRPKATLDGTRRSTCKHGVAAQRHSGL